MKGLQGVFRGQKPQNGAVLYSTRWASSSAGERLSYTEEAGGSTPSSPTRSDEGFRRRSATLASDSANGC